MVLFMFVDEILNASQMLLTNGQYVLCYIIVNYICNFLIISNFLFNIYYIYWIIKNNKPIDKGSFIKSIYKDVGKFNDSIENDPIFFYYDIDCF
jgi:hypothetical protein